MSRPLALLALAAVALLTIPRPPEPPAPLPALPAAASQPEGEWETELPDPCGHFCGYHGPELLQEAEVARAIEADHIGAPTVEPLAGQSGDRIDLRLAAFHVEPPPPVEESCIACPGPPLPPLPRFFWRAGATKSKLIRSNGANADSERAVANGLAWLTAQQQPDGGWQFDAGDRDDRIAATGLALLPFLGAGTTHKPSREAYLNTHRNAVSRGLEFLVRRCPPSGPCAGAMSPDPTAQALATAALCEAFGMTLDPALKPHAQAALNRLQKMQSPDGGWGDVFATGWAAQALLAAKTTRDLVVNDRVPPAAVAYLTAADAKPGTAAAAVVHFGRYHFADWGPGNPGFVAGANALFEQPPGRDPLHRYYAAWVLLRAEGANWMDWNAGPKGADGVRAGGTRDRLVAAQVRDADRRTSWDAEGASGERYGRLGTTALNLLTLEVYYRYLPLYKYGPDGNPIKILEDK
jgi:hypothetical protein